MSAALVIGVLVATGTFLVLQRGLVRTALGFVLLGHAVNLLLVVSGGIGRRGVPIGTGLAAPADPLPQAFALTAIVISFGVTAFLLSLAAKSRDVFGDDDVEDDDGKEGG